MKKYLYYLSIIVSLGIFIALIDGLIKYNQQQNEYELGLLVGRLILLIITIFTAYSLKKNIK